MNTTFKMRSDKNPQDVEFTNLWDKAVERYEETHGLNSFNNSLHHASIRALPVNVIWSHSYPDSTLTDLGGGYYEVKQHFGVEE